MVCPVCSTNNGITQYPGKCCKGCGLELVPKLIMTDDAVHATGEQNEN